MEDEDANLSTILDSLKQIHLKLSDLNNKVDSLSRDHNRLEQRSRQHSRDGASEEEHSGTQGATTWCF